MDKIFDFGYQPDKADRLKHEKLDENQEDSRREALRSRFREFDIGHDFDKKSFSQTLDNDMRSSSIINAQEVDQKDNSDHNEKDNDKDKDHKKDKDKKEDDRRKGRRTAILSDDDLLKELSRLPEAAPDDWVPDKADPVNNGGFSIAPDNGSPVPYKLNGWIDFQRKFPWEDEN